MGQVIELNRYKAGRRRAFLKRYEIQISKFVRQFLELHIRTSFESISHHYISIKQSEQAEAWDYFDFRDTLRDGFHAAYGKDLWTECQRMYWFDDRFLSEEDLVDRCITTMILGNDVSATR